MQLARLLAERKVQLDFVIDEGGNILTDGMPPLTTRPTAVIGTAEKVPMPGYSMLIACQISMSMCAIALYCTSAQSISDSLSEPQTQVSKHKPDWRCAPLHAAGL